MLGTNVTVLVIHCEYQLTSRCFNCYLYRNLRLYHNNSHQKNQTILPIPYCISHARLEIEYEKVHKIKNALALQTAPYQAVILFHNIH